MAKTLPKNADEYWERFLSKVDDFGNSPLHQAVISNSLEKVVFYLYCKADKNMKNACGKTPLDLAKAHNYQKIISILEEKDGSS